MTYVVIYRIFDEQEVAETHLLYHHAELNRAAVFAERVAKSKWLKKNGDANSWLTIMPTESDEYITVEPYDEKAHGEMKITELSDIV